MIKQKRIRNLSLHLHSVPEGTSVVCAIHVSDRILNRITQIGFTQELSDGESVLPSIVGPISRFNAEGHWIRHREKPKETAYRTVKWHWTEFHGDMRVERSDFKDVPYLRYPRTFAEPPSIELTLLRDNQNLQVLCAPTVVYSSADDMRLLHTINLFLELFGECELLNHELAAAIPPPTRRLNWRILPPGPMPWTQFREAIAPIIERERAGSRAFIEHRFMVLHEYHPDFKAVGNAGFTGYVIFGFESLKLYICESSRYGNATYVFAEGWEHLSQRSKAEILNGHLEQARIIHLSNWENEIRRLLRPMNTGSAPSVRALPPAA
jgi:hypothetical protein